MKKLIKSLALLLALTFQVSAQTNSPIAIKGNMTIDYQSRQVDKIVKGVKDIYTLNIKFGPNCLFHGTITDTPQILDGYFTKSVIQQRSLNYDIDLDLINPKPPFNTKNVGRMFGLVPITSDGVYHYDNGSLEVSIIPMGQAGGFDSKFGGVAYGKPLTRPSDWYETLEKKCKAFNITRIVNGKPMTVTLKKYDKMEFHQHIIAAGPVQAYQNVTVNGEMLYDYDKDSWFFNEVTVQYAEGNTIKIDRIAGTIRWLKEEGYINNGKSHYEFDVRVNEPQPGVNAAFDTTQSTDENAFFETDSSIPALTGTMTYQDRFKVAGEKDPTTLASQVDINLSSNNLTKQQAMVLTKVLIFSSVVPMNSD